MRNAVFWDMMLCGRNIPTFQTILLHTSLTLMMEPAGFSEMSVHFCCARIYSVTPHTRAVFIVTAVNTSGFTKYCYQILVVFSVLFSLLGSSRIVC